MLVFNSSLLVTLLVAFKYGVSDILCSAQLMNWEGPKPLARLMTTPAVEHRGRKSKRGEARLIADTFGSGRGPQVDLTSAKGHSTETQIIHLLIIHPSSTQSRSGFTWRNLRVLNPTSDSFNGTFVRKANGLFS